jgi:hypothetical protein
MPIRTRQKGLDASNSSPYALWLFTVTTPCQ